MTLGGDMVGEVADLLCENLAHPALWVKFEMKLLVILLAFFHLATVEGHPVAKIL